MKLNLAQPHMTPMDILFIGFVEEGPITVHLTLQRNIKTIALPSYLIVRHPSQSSLSILLMREARCAYTPKHVTYRAPKSKDTQTYSKLTGQPKLGWAYYYEPEPELKPAPEPSTLTPNGTLIPTLALISYLNSYRSPNLTSTATSSLTHTLSFPR